MSRWLLALLFAFGSVTFLTGCPAEEEGAADKAADKAEEGADKAEEGADKAEEGAGDAE